MNPKGRKNPGMFSSLLVIQWSATMTNGSGLTLDANVGGAADTSEEVSTCTYHRGKNATDGNNINDSIFNTQTGNINWQVFISTATVDTLNKAFEGAKPNIVCVLGLRFEKVDKKVAYDVFQNKFANYIARNMKYMNKVVCAVKEYKYLMTDY